MNNNNKNFELMDAISFLSFFMGVANLDANLTQNDKQEMLQELNEKIKMVLNEVHKHLEIQDKKIDEIYYLLTQIYQNQKEGVKNVQNPYYKA